MANYGNYARLRDAKAEVHGLAPVGADTTDAAYLRQIADASRQFENDCYGRHFYAYVGTEYVDGNGEACLWLPFDVVSISSLTVDEGADGTYETTLMEGTDFWLEPREHARVGKPYWMIELIPWATQVSAWPAYKRAVKITGVFGWSYETEDTGLTGTLTTTTDTELTASADASSLIFAGDVLRIEDEQVYVSAITAATLTVVRGVNGTTAAAHATKSLLVRRYPRNVEMAVMKRLLQTRWDVNTGMPMGQAGGRDYAEYMAVVDAYREGRRVSF